MTKSNYIISFVDGPISGMTVGRSFAYLDDGDLLCETLNADKSVVLGWYHARNVEGGGCDGVFMENPTNDDSWNQVRGYGMTYEQGLSFD